MFEKGFFTEPEASHLFKAGWLASRAQGVTFLSSHTGVATYAATLSFFIRMLEI